MSEIAVKDAVYVAGLERVKRFALKQDLKEVEDGAIDLQMKLNKLEHEKRALTQERDAKDAELQMLGEQVNRLADRIAKVELESGDHDKHLAKAQAHTLAVLRELGKHMPGGYRDAVNWFGSHVGTLPIDTELKTFSPTPKEMDFVDHHPDVDIPHNIEMELKGFMPAAVQPIVAGSIHPSTNGKPHASINSFGGIGDVIIDGEDDGDVEDSRGTRPA